ncbi:MAG TPA: hypothetical protein VK669_12130 [Candidatus Limnocylindrales bacterium]|nr:hypothetical protein [Candidatus Limnocylindrales bacterium]
MIAGNRYALYALETLLGAVDGIEREREGASASTHVGWPCGCAAFGRTTTALEVAPCPAHTSLFESDGTAR